ncbi:MAG: hypothetical protein FJZ01_27015 [Candidatus Sericytochromatia bacterium]|nr:hypothetical protein [Candidatus Tanganyikabacteria bacterium]
MIERVTPGVVVDRIRGGEPHIILDVRSPHAYAEASEDLAGAVRMEPDMVDPAFLQIDKSIPIYTFCT